MKGVGGARPRGASEQQAEVVGTGEQALCFRTPRSPGRSRQRIPCTARPLWSRLCSFGSGIGTGWSAALCRRLKGLSCCFSS